MGMIRTEFSILGVGSFFPVRRPWYDVEILQSSPDVEEFGPEGDHDEESEAEEFLNDDIQK